MGIALLSVNIAGLFTGLRNDDIYHEPIPGRFGISLSEQQVYERIRMARTFDRRKLVVDLTDAVNAGIAHYWQDEGIDRYNLRVPLHENYLLWLASFVFPERYQKYEFTNFRRAIERGVGLCSQSAIIEAEVLKEGGIPSRIVALAGHVVVTAEVDAERGEWWVLDPDYGVTIPHNMLEIEANPSSIADYYRAATYNEETISNLIRLYEEDGNLEFPGEGARPYHTKMWFVEEASYIMIWIIPLMLISPLGIKMYRRAETDFAGKA